MSYFLHFIYLVLFFIPSSAATLSGQIVAEGKPFPGAKLVAEKLQIGVSEENRPVAITIKADAEGKFTTQINEPGQYMFIAAMDKWVLAENTKIIKINENDIEATFQLVKPSIVTGKVLFESGKPAIGIQLRFFQTKYPAGHIVSFWDKAGKDLWQQNSTLYRTDDRGQFRVNGLTQGEYYVCANLSLSDAEPKAANCYGNGSSLEKIVILENSVTEGVEITLRLRDEFEVTGRTSTPDNTILPKLTIFTRAGASAWLPKTTSDENGKFSFRITEGPIEIQARSNELDAAKYISDSYASTIKEDTSINLKVQATANISGTVQGQLTPELWTLLLKYGLALLTEKGEPLAHLALNADHTFSISSLAPGTIAIISTIPAKYGNVAVTSIFKNGQALPVLLLDPGESAQIIINLKSL
ncbi:MAG: hypothetical protein JST84_05275 [Acidobacteria bacterium]|nr:hypothetical protein [Acidobacteriota bacterium]